MSDFAAIACRGSDGILRCSTRRDFTRSWVHALRIRWADGWNKVPKVRQLRHSMWLRRSSSTRTLKNTSPRE
jgi:hypothetical protein